MYSIKVLRHLITMLLPASSLLLLVSTAAYSETGSVTGTYSVEWAKDAGCELKIAQIENEKLRFELSCNRGAPSYNSGLAEGVIGIKDHLAKFVTGSAPDLCEIQFLFKEKGVVVSQNGTAVDCGFGWGVYSDGLYTLKNREQPKFD